jgi:hypothetical protein
LYSAFVLAKQQELQEANDMNSNMKLAATAMSRSTKSAEKARIRAAFAA